MEGPAADESRGCRWAFLPGIILIPQSTPGWIHPKKTPPAPQSGANPGIRGNKTPGRTYCWTKGISLGAEHWDVSKQGLEKLQRVQGLWAFSWRCQKSLLRCKRTFCASDAPEGWGFLFSTPSLRSQRGCEDEGWEWKAQFVPPMGTLRGQTEIPGLAQP